jgi:hypothetical protein
MKITRLRRLNGKPCLFLLFAFLLCAGCNTARRGLTGADKPELLDANHLGTFSYTKPIVPTDRPYYWTEYAKAGEGLTGPEKDQARRAVRNQILSDLQAIIDYNYHSFENGLRGDVAIKNTSVDIITLGLTATATAVGAKEVKTILSAIATGVVGANASVDKNVFQSNTVQALQLEMRKLRSDIGLKIKNGMEKADADYPLQKGIDDIVDYYYAGSITDALLGLVKDTGVAEKKSTDALQ